jgi:hypothetical protein
LINLTQLDHETRRFRMLVDIVLGSGWVNIPFHLALQLVAIGSVIVRMIDTDCIVVPGECATMFSRDWDMKLKVEQRSWQNVIPMCRPARRSSGPPPLGFRPHVHTTDMMDPSLLLHT